MTRGQSGNLTQCSVSMSKNFLSSATGLPAEHASPGQLPYQLPVSDSIEKLVITLYFRSIEYPSSPRQQGVTFLSACWISGVRGKGGGWGAKMLTCRGP